MDYFVYILKSLKNNRYYTGMSSNPSRRLAYHNLGTNLSTKSEKPFKLVYLERYDNKTEAIKRERQIKSYKGGNAFKLLIK